MRKSVRRAFVLVSMVCVALLVSATAAFAQAHDPAPAAYIRPGSFGPLAIPPGSKYMDLPMGTGGVVTGYIPGGAYHVYHSPLYVGQSIQAKLYPNSNVWRGWELALFNRNIQYDSLQAVYSGSTLSQINFNAVPVTIDGVTRQFDFGYDIVVFGPPQGGSYRLEWDASDPTVSNIIRCAGASRYLTAYWCVNAFTSPKTFVVATGKDFADALAASALCGTWDAPLILAEPTRITPQIKTWLEGANPDRIFVVGSNKAVSDAVFASLQKPGRTVERVQGPTRFETAIEIAKRVRDHEISLGHTPNHEALIVNGQDYPDALSVSPYAFSMKMPVLLVRPGTLPPVTRDSLAGLGVDSVHVIGSNLAISNSVMGGLPAATKDRVYGANRIDTSSQVASYAVDAGWADWKHVAVATGYNFPDGLAAGVFVGKQGGVMLLSKPLYVTKETFESIYDHRSELTPADPNASGPSVSLWGGTTSLSGFVKGEIGDALSGMEW